MKLSVFQKDFIRGKLNGTKTMNDKDGTERLEVILRHQHFAIQQSFQPHRL